MIKTTNMKRLSAKLPLIKVDIFGEEIPTLSGAKTLLEKGYESTLSPANKIFLNLLDSKKSYSAYISLISRNGALSNSKLLLLKKLLVDPQTCGPLLISCDSDVAKGLIKDSSWHRIGLVDFLHKV